MSIRRPFDKDFDKSSPNRNIAPITTEVDSEEGICVGGGNLSDLAKKYGTPLYILDELTIRRSCKEYRESLNKYYPGKSIALYASKANSSLALSSIVASEGMGIDVVSEGELVTAIKGGIPSRNIVFHGNNKSFQELKLAYENDVVIVLDNQHDIQQLETIVKSGQRKARLMIRFTPGIECHTHDYIKTGMIDSKFGFNSDELEDIFLRFQHIKWGDLIGLHAHIGSQIFEVEPHRDLAEVMGKALKIGRDLGHPIDIINVGGGLGIKYISTDDPPSINSWVKVVSEAIHKACISRSLELPLLMCEPGRSIIGTAGLTVYSAVSYTHLRAHET